MGKNLILSRMGAKNNLKINLKTNSKIKLKKFVLAGIFSIFFVLSACSLDDSKKTPKLLSSNTAKQENGKNSSTIELNFNKNLNSDSVNKDNISLKDENGALIDKNKYSISVKENKIEVTIVDEELKSKSGTLTLEAKNLQDGYGKKIAPISTKVELKDSIAPKVTSYNLGVDVTIKSNKSLRVNFDEKLKDDLSKAYLKYARGTRVAKNLYNLTFSNDNQSLNLSLISDDLKKRTGAYKLVFGDLTDPAGNKIENLSFIEFSFLDSIVPKLVDSSIKDGKLISGQKEVELKFDEPVKGEISIDKTPSGGGTSSRVDADKYSVKFSADKKTITIKFTDAPAANFNYSINLANITDLADNKIDATQTDNQPKFAVANKSDYLFVKVNPSGNENGSNWANAISLKKALAQANKTIFVASGTYKLTSATESFTIANGVKVYGGFNSSRTFDINYPFDKTKNPRELEGSILEGKIDNNTNTNTLIKITSGSATRVLEAFVLKNTFTSNNGGGIYIKNASDIKIKNLTFKNNIANAGGAIYLDNAQYIDVISSNFTDNSYSAIYAKNNSTVNIEKSNFNKNQGSTGGAGAIASDSSNLTINKSEFTKNPNSAISATNNSRVDIKDSTFTENSATAISVNESIMNIEKSTFNKNQGNSGGAISATNSTVKIENATTFTGNFSKSKSASDNAKGGAIYSENSLFTIKGATFTKNLTAKNTEASDETMGGAIYATGKRIQISQSTFSENQSAYGAGVRLTANAIGNISSTKFSANKSSRSGGGAYVFNSKLNLRDVKFTTNESPQGAGIYVKNSNLLVSNSWFSANISKNKGVIKGDGGAIFIDTFESAQNNYATHIRNSIFYENKSENKGGALSVENSQIFVLNSTFHKNSAKNGGAIHNDLKQSAKIYNSIFWENKRTGTGTGTGTINSFHTSANDDANLSLQNSIVDANSLTMGATSASLAINSSNKTNDPQLKLSTSAQNPSIGLKTNSPAKGIGKIKLYYELSGDDSASKWASDFNGNSRFTIGSSARKSLNLGAVESSGSSSSLSLVETDKSIKGLTAFYVTPEGKSTNSGANWQEALDLKTALTKAIQKNTILLAQGTYKFTDKNDKLELKGGVKIYGGFDPQAPAAGRDLEASRIDGGNTARNSALIQSKDASASQLLNGLVIENTKNTKADNPVTDQNGGGLLVNNSDIELSHIKLQNNETVNNGGAIYAFSESADKSIKISNSAFIKNSSAYAGALYLFGGKLTATIKNTSFTENSAEKQGGAIHSQKNVKININKTSFTKNKVTTTGTNEGQGGAIYLAEAVELKFKNSLFAENQSSHSSGSGIYVNMGSKIVGLNSAFYANTSGYGGTIDLNDKNSSSSVYSSAILANTTFYNNKATTSGCAAVQINTKNNISVYNSVFVNNQFKHTTASKNSDNCFLGYLQGDIDKLGNIEVKNSYYKKLFVKRNDGTFTDAKPGTGTGYSVAVSNNLFGSAFIITDFIEPPLKVNYLPLSKTSTAKNKGDNTLYLEVYDKIKCNANTTSTIPSEDKDLAGKPRLSPATTGTIDIGAYELQE